MKHINFLGIEFDVQNMPVLDEGFIPMHAFNTAFLKTATKELNIAVERNAGYTSVFKTKIHGTEEMFEADCFYAERMVKFLLWAMGGYKVYICGDKKIYEHIKKEYAKDGKRAFDFDFMSKVYEKDFEVLYRELSETPEEKIQSKSVGRNFDGCRIGFDAGGSDRKVSAVIDGECVYSDETVWLPKVTEDPEYHFQGILDSMKKAAAKMPRVDAIGISSAGIYVDNRTMVASLFLAVPEDDFNKHVKDIYIRACKEFGDIPFEVANDGDVTALAGAMSLEDTNVLGIAMGTSEAVGYVDGNGNITGWLNELAFAPVDAQREAMVDEWSGDIGVGCKYFSQDSVNKLAPRAGIELDEKDTPANKLKVVQGLMEQDDERAVQVYESIGVYLGHTIAYYADFYDLKHLLLLGRVMSGKGGDIIIRFAEKVLNEEYPELAKKAELHVPDEKTRRVGQSAAAASLPKIVK